MGNKNWNLSDRSARLLWFFLGVACILTVVCNSLLCLKVTHEYSLILNEFNQWKDSTLKEKAAASAGVLVWPEDGWWTAEQGAKGLGYLNGCYVSPQGDVLTCSSCVVTSSMIVMHPLAYGGLPTTYTVTARYPEWNLALLKPVTPLKSQVPQVLLEDAAGVSWGSPLRVLSATLQNQGSHLRMEQAYPCTRLQQTTTKGDYLTSTGTYLIPVRVPVVGAPVISKSGGLVGIVVEVGNKIGYGVDVAVVKPVMWKGKIFSLK